MCTSPKVLEEVPHFAIPNPKNSTIVDTSRFRVIFESSQKGVCPMGPMEPMEPMGAHGAHGAQWAHEAHWAHGAHAAHASHDFFGPMTLKGIFPGFNPEIQRKINHGTHGVCSQAILRERHVILSRQYAQNDQMSNQCAHT
jgi:hypothetical protein